MIKSISSIVKIEPFSQFRVESFDQTLQSILVFFLVVWATSRWGQSEFLLASQMQMRCHFRWQHNFAFNVPPYYFVWKHFHFTLAINIWFNLIKTGYCVHIIAPCSRNFQNVKLRFTTQEFICDSNLREIDFGMIWISKIAIFTISETLNFEFW